MIHRRALLAGLGPAALALPFYRTLLGRPAQAADGVARRVIFFYFPDGVAAQSQSGEASLWHPTGSEYSFELPYQLEPLADFKDRCVFINGLSMGATDSGSHPGGAKKLLTAADYGNNESIDQYLARTAGVNAPFRHVALGAMANYNGASGDKHISYIGSGSTVTPEDDPLAAFDLLFDGATSSGGGSSSTDTPSLRGSVIDGVKSDLDTLRAQLGGTEAAKLDLHLEAVREVEARITGTSTGGAAVGSCDTPALDYDPLVGNELYDQGRFPDILRAQIDLMVLAMSCGRTQVGLIQGSHHTSELIMSRFEGTEMYDPSYDMRSHQASHYGDRHDWSKREFTAYVAQRRWWVSQFAYLLEQLDARVEGDGTMLDHSLVVLCTEVCDGNTHLHDNMPFVLAGGAGGAMNTGRLAQYWGYRHADLWTSVARALGQDLWSFGEACAGPLYGLMNR